MSQLAYGWVFSNLEELGLPTTPNVNPENHQDEIFELYSVPAYAEGTPEILTGAEIGSTKQEVQPGDILLCKIVPHLIRVWVVGEKREYRQIASGEWIVVRPPFCNEYYIRHLLMEPEFREKFMQTVSGVGGSLLRARPKLVAQIDIPIAPLPEQHRIVDKLDVLFERTRQARKELEHIPTLIEHYKQAILAAAFRGELTADWRAKHQPPQVHADISGIDGRTGQLPGIPDVWGWASIDSISQVSGGLTKNTQRRELKKKVPYLRVANVYANELRLDEVKEIGCTDSELAKTQLQQGDLLVVEGNGSIEQIGRVAIWDGSITPCSHQNHIIRVRPNEQVISPYILFWMISPLGRQYIERVASSSSGLHTLSISKVSGLAIPVCSIDEQIEVVRQIKEAFAWLDIVLHEATAALHLLDHLDEATLAKAFRGELVPQDPNDEPASVLLERIRGARAEQSNGNRRHKRQ